MASLWGSEFDVSKVVNKVSNPRTTKMDASKAVKSKSVNVEEKLRIIKTEVNRILGVYEENTQVIRTKEEFIAYIDKAIENGVIAIDTETNNSLDPLTCKLMGACIYTPDMKNAYIPINHTNLSGDRLPWQLTENDVREQFDRLQSTKIIMHNGKFDYEVIKCTCDCTLDIYWDTMVASKVINENERAGLKQQYIEKIDPSIEKYSIDHLFTVDYAIVDPDVFALYAATDSFMTYKLYEYQYEILSRKENERLMSLFMDIEMPIVIVASDMELTGVTLDLEYSKRLSEKYHKRYDELQDRIAEELHKYDSAILEWRATKDANVHPPKKSGNGVGKSKSEQLETPVNLTSPTQLAILLYDVLKVKSVSKKSPRGTGEDILKKLDDIPLCGLILEQRGLLKLINTYIDKLPECISPRDGRLHAHFNQYGADTGRFSSSDPNLQNIPSHENSIRMMFTASCDESDTEIVDDSYFEIDSYSEVLTSDGWKGVKDVNIGDALFSSDMVCVGVVINIELVEKNHKNYAKLYIN